MIKLFSRTNGLILLVVLFCCLLVFLIWYQLLNQMWNDRKETVAAAVEKNSNLAASLEQYAISTIRNADAVLQLVKMEKEQGEKNINFNTLFTRGVIDLNYFHSVFIVDENGKLENSNIEIQQNNVPDFSDRDFFNFHKEHSNELFITKPVISKTIGRAVIILSRRLEHTDGRFAGVIAVQIEPSTFTKFYYHANLGENDIMSLISPDGITYARRKGKIESYGEDIHLSPLFHHLKKSAVSNYKAKDAIYGIPTYFSYRKLKDFPMIATVGASEDEVLAGYNNRKRREFIFGSIITGLLVLFTYMITNVLLQRKRVTRKIRISETRYRSIFENSQDAIVVVLPDGSIEAMNPASIRLFRADDKQKQQLSFSGLFKESSPGISLGVEHPNKFPEKEEVLFTRFDNTVFTAEVLHSCYLDYKGNPKYVVLIRDISFRKEMEQRLQDKEKMYQRKLTKEIILAQEREREAIGHEMHDNVNQILTSIKLFLEMSMKNPSLREELIPKSIGHIMECITEIRNLSRELSAPTLGTKSLIDSIKSLVETIEVSSGLVIYFEHDLYRIPLIKDQNLAIYRILQEQLNNIIKHAAATVVRIVLSQQENMTELIIRDNGKGFDINAKRKGIGLNNILSRTIVFDGEFEITSQPGKGTELRICLPVMQSEEEIDISLQQHQMAKQLNFF